MKSIQCQRNLFLIGYWSHTVGLSTFSYIKDQIHNLASAVPITDIKIHWSDLHLVFNMAPWQTLKIAKFSRSLKSKNKDKDLQINPRGQGLSWRTVTLENSIHLILLNTCTTIDVKLNICISRNNLSHETRKAMILPTCTSINTTADKHCFLELQDIGE